ncbi:trimethylamine-N-oxide reductase (cytochrome c) [Rhodopseudomonas rhenobacensis]|uniref:trimethylamine-N-oxide reductase n=1 Tax=Rhodopseudomonas rhenobacensis TaxID=87461 RepID=A0A7W7Z255_9BRAD|nr:trimethylamine-N-oxide reductase TorA [Rhodopseudomonas rhenobacensis]MBB5046582.1 trimethylamine-N-oxide reductase (cytochrome c) [Rhodopseudomonas rhenobacensis]
MLQNLKEKKMSETHSLSRRRFLSATSSLTALAAADMMLPGVVGRAFAAEAPKEILTGSHWGAFYAKVDNGRFTSLRPWEKDFHPNAALDGVQDVVYSSSRIRYPMVRRAYLEKGIKADRDSRGDGDFVRVSWDKALDLVAGELKRLEEQEGPWAVYAGSYGWRSSGEIGNPQIMLTRLMNLNGGAVYSSSNYSKAALEGIMPYVVGSIDAAGPQTTYQSVIENTKTIVFWGADPFKTNQIAFALPDHEEYKWFEDMKKAGIKAIFINPINVEASKYLNAEWLAIRPHSDVALAIAICHVLLTEKLYDKEFIANCTFGFDKFSDYLLGKGWDKVEKTPEWAAALTEIPADVIRRLAHQFVENRTMLVSGWSCQRQHHGEQWPWAFVTLASMIGQVGLPGGGFCQNYHLYSLGSPATMAPALAPGMSGGTRKANKPWPKEKGAQSIPVARVVDMLEKPGQTYEHNGEKKIYPDVKLTYWVGGNPFHHHQDRNRMRKAWRKFETVIVQDFQWTASARFADIVLPATTTTERDDIEMVGANSKRAYIAMKKVVEPLFESKSDYAIFTALAERLGLGQEFTEGKSELDMVRDVYAAAKKTADAKKTVTLPAFEEFWEKGIIEFETPAKNQRWVKYADFREDPIENMLPTGTGKIELYSKPIEKMGYDDCPPHASWLEPLEWLGQKDKAYPLHMNSNHPLHRMHSQLNGTRVRKIYEVADREPCMINTKDAAARGIKNGDVVRVFNGRGQCLAGAVVSDDIRPSVVQLQEGAWYDPVDIKDANTLCKHGDVNVLTPDIGSSRLAQATSAHTCLVDVEKYTGPLPKVTVFDAPANA